MTELKKALYAGTFDPFTNGHLDIVNRSLKVFDEITIVIAVPPNKSPLFSKDQRVEMLNELFKENSNVKIDTWDGLIVDYAKKNKIPSIVRGLRPTGDFEIEFQMASMNQSLHAGIETFFLMTSGEHYFVSSTLIREILKHSGDISPFVPKEIFNHINKK